MYSDLTEDANNIGVFMGLSIISISSISFISFIVYGKLKSKKCTYKDIENRIRDIQSHQMSSASRTKATSTVSSNPLVRLIAGFAGSYSGSGNGAQYQRFEGEESSHRTKKPATAEAGSQVCQEIISKRERRSLSGQCSGEEADTEPSEGFIQGIFESSAPEASCCESTNQGPSEDVKVLQTYTCSVCLDELCLGNTNMTTTSCGHTFHLSCLLKSLTQKNLCPMCRGELEDVRTKQMPANVLTPVSAEQLIDEEISYFTVGSHLHSIMLSRHPKRRAKEMLRVFGFTLLRTVAEYVHDENMPPGWFDDAGTESESDTDEEEDGEENENDDTDTNSEEGEEGEEGDQNAVDEDELNYAVENERRLSRQQEEQQANQQRYNTRSSLRNGRDLRDFISE